MRIIRVYRNRSLPVKFQVCRLTSANAHHDRSCWRWQCSNLYNEKNLPIIRVELWVVNDIVTKMPDIYLGNDTLINPANSTLSGTQLPYFPRGGPLPKGEVGRTSMWGGMEAGEGMLYPAQAVDGRVHAEGGEALGAILKQLHGNYCDIGESVVTPATGQLKLKHQFEYVIHTVPPLSCHCPITDSLPETLISSYRTALRIFIDSPDMWSAAMPLVGSGTCGFTPEVSAKCLLSALSSLIDVTTTSSGHREVSTAEWNSTANEEKSEVKTIRIAVLDTKTANSVKEVLFDVN